MASLSTKRPSLGSTVNAVLDAFKAANDEWTGGIGFVEAEHLFGLNYRWMPAVHGGHLGVSENCGFTLRKATDAEYSELENGLAEGSVNIVLHNRISREAKVLHQATGKPIPMN